MHFSAVTASASAALSTCLANSVSQGNVSTAWWFKGWKAGQGWELIPLGQVFQRQPASHHCLSPSRLPLGWTFSFFPLYSRQVLSSHCVAVPFSGEGTGVGEWPAQGHTTRGPTCCLWAQLPAAASTALLTDERAHGVLLLSLGRLGAPWGALLVLIWTRFSF